MKLTNEIIMHTPDCCFQDKDNNRFRLRAAGIIIENDCILFATNESENYYYSIGGGIHLGETAEQAVLREVLEETGTAYEIDRLAFIQENFFKREDGLLKGLSCHEITFYFLMKSRGTQQLNSDSYTHGIKEVLEWLPIDKLQEYEAYPTFIKEKLKILQPHIEHILTIQKDRS